MRMLNDNTNAAAMLLAFFNRSNICIWLLYNYDKNFLIITDIGHHIGVASVSSSAQLCPADFANSADLFCEICGKQAARYISN